MGKEGVTKSDMNVLVIVESQIDISPMKLLLRKAGIEGTVTPVFEHKPTHKPTIKELRGLRSKRVWDQVEKLYDYVIASGETAARFILNTSIVNINKLRGRNFEFKP